MAPNKEQPPQAEEPAGVESAAMNGVHVNDRVAAHAGTGGVSGVPDPPYPITAKAGGFKFELDIERMRQSDTWAIAEPRQRPFLVMVWIESWAQLPAGSLPDNDAVIAARIGMPPQDFRASKDVLMRGWWKASDGRLYHPTITEQVIDMLSRKNRKAANQAAYRERQRVPGTKGAESTGPEQVDDQGVTGHSPVTDSDVPGDPPVIDRTTTTTTTREQEKKHLHGAEAPSRRSGDLPAEDSVVPTDAGTGILIPLKDGSEYAVTSAEVVEWTAAYPDKDVLVELRKARAWCIANKEKRKTRRRASAFLNGWLARPPLPNAQPGRRNSTDAHFEGIAQKFANYNGPTVSLL